MGGHQGQVFCGLLVVLQEIILLSCDTKLYGAPEPPLPPLRTPKHNNFSMQENYIPSHLDFIGHYYIRLIIVRLNANINIIIGTNSFFFRKHFFHKNTH